MPVTKCPNGKWKIGSGECMYDSKAKAEKAYKGYMAKKHMHELKYEIKISLGDFMKMNKKLEKAKINIINMVNENGSNK